MHKKNLKYVYYDIIYFKVFYCWSKPFHLGFLPTAELRQVSQRAAVRWEGAVHKLPASAEVVIFQLRKVLVLELGRVGRTSLAAFLEAQVDDRGA